MKLQTYYEKQPSLYTENIGGTYIANGYTLSPPFFWMIFQTKTGFLIAVRRVYGENFKEGYIKSCSLGHTAHRLSLGDKYVPVVVFAPGCILCIDNTRLDLDSLLNTLATRLGVVFC